MPRIKPTKNIDIIGRLERKIKESHEEYQESRANGKNFGKLPNIKASTDCIEAVFVQCTKEHKSLLELQRIIVADSKWNAVLNKRKESLMYSSQYELRQRFIDMTRKLKELKDKYNEAFSTISSETEEQNFYKKRIRERNVEFETLFQFREELYKTVTNYECYEKLLQSFVKENKLYTSVDDFISRTDAIMYANTEIVSMNLRLSKSIEALQKMLVAITRDIAATVVHMKNELDFFARSYSAQIAECKELEDNLHKIKVLVRKHEVDRFRLLEGIYNVYSLLCKRIKKPNSFKSNEIDKICLFLSEESDTIKKVLRVLEEKRSRKNIVKIKKIQK